MSKFYPDNTLLSPRVVVNESGLDVALRRLKAASNGPELRRKRYFVGPSEQRRQKHRRALQRRNRRGNR